MKCIKNTTIHPQNSLPPDLSPPSGEAKEPEPKIPGTTDLHPRTTKTASHIHSMSKTNKQKKVAFSPPILSKTFLRTGTQEMRLCAPNGTRQHFGSKIS